jgi:hypothetical protein
VIKKTIVEGSLVKQVFTSPLIFLHDFFGTSPVEVKPIRHGTTEYRTYKKKIVSEGRATKWGAISTGVDKQHIADKKFDMMNNRGRV